MLVALSFVLSMIHPLHAQEDDYALKDYTTPTRQLTVTEYPQFNDDLELAELATAARLQLQRFKTVDLSGTIELGGVKYPLKNAQKSLELVLELVDQFKTCRLVGTTSACFAALNAQIRSQYNVFVPALAVGDPRYGEPQDSFFTGYATQPINARAKPSGDHTLPVYAMPDSAHQVLTRQEIDFKDGLKGQNLELAYAADRYDLYMLHIEGGGYATLEDNGKTSHFYLTFAGTNQQKWTWISTYMLAKGYINNLSNAAQRKYLRLHPEKHEEIFSQCPSYVYFTATASPPQGSAGVSVTPGRSIATDRKLYTFKGLLAFVQSQRPVDSGHYDMEEEDVSRIPFQPFSRFFIDQDTGGAITGKGRADLYFGISDYAQYAAAYQAQKGNLFFLLAK